MINNGPQIPNRYHTGRKNNQPSVIISLVLLGGLAYGHYGKDGLFSLFNSFTNQVAVEEKQDAPASEPNYVTAKTELKAYGSQKLNQEVGIVPVGTTLKIKNVEKDAKGNIVLLMVKANGFNVWIKNENLEFSE